MDGFLCVYKPSGMTSFDVIAKLRKLLNTRHLGHTGTLDPQASGVLIVLVNKACKVLPYLKDTNKEYIATLQLGYDTDTEDIWGNKMNEKAVQPIKDFPSLLQEFVGKQEQLPPMVSAIKINGKKLYEYARENVTVERPLRWIEVYEMECLDETELKFRCACSSGTYIRSICRDLALKSNNLGCMSSLVRTKVGRFDLDDCVSLQQIAEGNYELKSVDLLLDHYEQVQAENVSDVMNGKRIRIQSDQQQVLIMNQQQPLAIYEKIGPCLYASKRGLW